MATTYKLRYKNHCIPQEQRVSGDRYYLDSDCGKRLTGDCAASGTGKASVVYGNSVVASPSTTTLITAGYDSTFVYVKNTGNNDILLTLDDSNYLIRLSPNEAFASEISEDVVMKAKGDGGTSTVTRVRSPVA